jgi:hypothetical protein
MQLMCPSSLHLGLSCTDVLPSLGHNPKSVWSDNQLEWSDSVLVFRIDLFYSIFDKQNNYSIFDKQSNLSIRRRALVFDCFFRAVTFQLFIISFRMKTI